MNQFDELYFTKYVKEGDELLFVCHRHPILIIDNILLWCFFAVAIPAFLYLQNSFGIATALPSYGFELYLIGVYLCLGYAVFDWYNDVWLITNRGVIDVDWQHFTSNILYVDYHSIHGIEIKTHSIFDGLLGKGDIYVHLNDGEHDEFFLSDSVNPQWIVEYIQAVVDELAHHGHDEEDVVDDRKPFELLLDTLTEMVKEHLEKKGNPMQSEGEYKEAMEKVLRHTSTIDLREDSNWSSSGHGI